MNGFSLPTLRLVVLAAGYSRRLGRPKALAKIRGISLLRRTVALLAPFAAAGVVVVVPPRSARYAQELRGFKITVTANPRRALGLSSSVRQGVRHARGSAALLLLPVDLALLRRRDIARLVARWRGARRRVVARNIPGRGRGGTPLILPRWLYRRALRIEGDVGLRDLIAQIPEHYVDRVHLPSAELDIDTAQELRAARRRHGSR
jgi:molybdenum cofactor cytidylyltransferase